MNPIPRRAFPTLTEIRQRLEQLTAELPPSTHQYEQVAQELARWRQYGEVKEWLAQPPAS